VQISPDPPRITLPIFWSFAVTFFAESTCFTKAAIGEDNEDIGHLGKSSRQRMALHGLFMNYKEFESTRGIKFQKNLEETE
jgi:hypothetical protein